MAVQQNKKSPSKRGMHRSHNALTVPGIAVEPTTGETHLRHPRQPQRFLSRPQGPQDQERRLSAPFLPAEGPSLPSQPGPFFCPPRTSIPAPRLYS